MRPQNNIDRLVSYSLNGGLPLLFFIFSLLAGLIALNFTAREEEPQIVVPMIDVLVSSPGLSAQQTERQVTIPLEKLLAQIPGVEHVYSSSDAAQTAVTLRFHVGENRELAILNTYNKLYSNQDKMPAVVDNWLVRPVEVDDVAIVMLGLWSDDEQRYSDYELRRLADELSNQLQSIDNTSEVNIVGGRTRSIQVLIKAESLAARQSTAMDIVHSLQQSNRLKSNGRWTLNNQAILLESGDVIRDIDTLANTVINVIDGNAVLLKDVAEIIDGPREADHYSWLDLAPQHEAFTHPRSSKNLPLVTISIAKQAGSNAVKVAEDVHKVIAKLKKTLLPPDIHIEVLRDYGATANEKVDNLTTSLAFAVFTVVIFIAVFLGWRPALVVGLAVPISYGVTLMLDMAFGYTINRVTLFALILSLGLLVDDPITGVDNIQRFLNKKGERKSNIIKAISEIRIPLIMSTITIILAFIPLAFITGMMGPYMAPMAFNVPVSVATSTAVAFIVTPWLADKLLKPSTRSQTSTSEGLTDDNTPLLRFYRRLLNPLLNNRTRAKQALLLVLVLFIVTALLPVLRAVPLKLLPFDNKNEIQILIDMPEGSSLEQTAATTKSISNSVQKLNEIKAVAAYVGIASPIDFNGMVRRYYQRQLPHMAELRLTLLDKDKRHHQSHAVVLRLREKLTHFNQHGISIKVVEVPPGPPVLSTIVAEISGSPLTDYEKLQEAARSVMQRLQREAHVVEIDSTVEAPQQRLRFIADKHKAALSGISTENINNSLQLASEGHIAGFMQIPRESKPLPIEVRLPQQERASLEDLQRLQVKGRPGITQKNSKSGLVFSAQPLVAIGELGQFEWQPQESSRHRKDLKPVVYVTAELSGRTPAEIIADMSADKNSSSDNDHSQDKHWQSRTYLNNGGGDSWAVAEDIEVSWSGEGEWKITLDVFRDMGIAFLFALVGIFFVLKIQTQSNALTLIIMSAIPLTIIGIMPGFFLLNQFGEREIAGSPEPVLFTATAMIGMIALAGIVVRNSLILVEYITQSRAQGFAIKEALVQAGAVRMRPVLLTAGTTLLGNLVITLDPVFSGLALAIMFGIIASTIFTLIVVPVVYMLVFDTDDSPNSQPGKPL